jgi:hypothetical protein
MEEMGQKGIEPKAMISDAAWGGWILGMEVCNFFWGVFNIF